MEYRTEYEYEYNGSKFSQYAAEDKSQLKSFIDWHDHIFIYDKWETMPNLVSYNHTTKSRKIIK